jgi:membrane-associated phospholipid phosphatase
MSTWMKKYSIFLTGFLLLIHLSANAQDDTLSIKQQPPASGNTNSLSIVPDKAYFKTWGTDARDIAIAPVRWNKYQWIAFSGVAVVTGLLLTQDARIQQIVQKNQAAYLNNVSTYGLEPWGSGLYALPALGIMYGLGAILKDDKARYTALKGGEAYLFAFLSAQILKQLTHRHRPYQDSPPDPYDWDGPIAPVSYNSFPSGHSTVIFALAAVIGTSYSKTIWVPIVCYTLAGLTAASRVYQNDHWFSDVFVGSALGFAIGRMIINNHMKRLKLVPASPTGVGVTLVVSLD